ncbi:MAG: NAD(P)-dependent oxidoreductase [Pseudomonadota bacterium]|nr:NAD(P)-dependent oxidoreductase [Pseudomonadota bacterium]
MSRPKVGFIGIGTMGRPMAACIAEAQMELHIYDIDPSAASAFADEYAATVHDTPAKLAQACDIAITMVPTGADVREVALGNDGLADAFAGDGILIDMSSSEPAGTEALAAELAGRGVRMIDAPVSGGRAKAVDGTLTLIVGGDDAVIDQCQSVLEAMGNNIFRTGRVGSGHAIKAINNLMNAAGLLVGGEALLIGKRFGLDPDIIVDVINASTGMNHATVNKFKQRVFSRSFDSGFSLDLMIKDLDIALGLARDTRTPVPYAAHCREIWAAAGLNLEDGRDHTEIVRWLEQTSGAELE